MHIINCKGSETEKRVLQGCSIFCYSYMRGDTFDIIRLNKFQVVGD